MYVSFSSPPGVWQKPNSSDRPVKPTPPDPRQLTMTEPVALSVRQPWAALIVAGVKLVEVRYAQSTSVW